MDRDLALRDIGYRLRISLQATGQSFAEIARRCEISHSRLGNWMRGDSPVDILVLAKIRAQYSVNLDYILLGRGALLAKLPARAQSVRASAFLGE